MLGNLVRRASLLAVPRALGPLSPAAAPALPQLCGACRQLAIHMKTRLKVIDNSGAKEVECIDFYSKANAHYGKKAKVGEAIRVVVKKAAHDGRVSKKDIVGAVIARQAAVKRRADGSTVRFQENAAVVRVTGSNC